MILNHKGIIYIWSFPVDQYKYDRIIFMSLPMKYMNYHINNARVDDIHGIRKRT